MRHPSDSRMLREVAADIRAKAAEEKKNGYLRADVQFSCRTRHGLIVRCQGTEEAIEQMVKRYEKASRKRTNGTAVGAFRRKTKCPSTKPAYLTGFNSLVESGDTANALELASLYKFEVYFIHTENGPRLLSSPGLLSDSRFVCGRRETTNQCRWSVTHIDSGLSMGAGETKKEALADHHRLMRKWSGKLESTIAKKSCDFQTTARKHWEEQHGG